MKKNKIKTCSEFLNEEETDQISVLTQKLQEYNNKKGQLKTFLNKDNEQDLFDKFLLTLQYKDNDLLRFEWAYLKSERDVQKYKTLINNTLKEYTSKKI